MDSSHRVSSRVMQGVMVGRSRGGVARAARFAAAMALIGALSLVGSTGCSTASPSTASSSSAKAVGRTSGTLTAEQQQLNVASFDEVWNTIKDKHFDPKLNGADWSAARDELRPKVAAATTMVEAREQINELISRLKQTHFGLIPSEAYAGDATSAEVESGASGSSVGSSSSPATKPSRKDGYLGLEVRAIDNKAIVWRVDADSPADLAGVKTGWELVSVGNRAMRPVLARATSMPTHVGLGAPTLQALVSTQMLATSVGSVRHLGFLDAFDKAQVVSVTATEPRGSTVKFGHLPSTHLRLERRLLPSNVGYVSISIWLDPPATVAFIEAAVKEFKSADGLIIDVRGNPGGLGVIAPAVAGYLIGERDKELGTLITRQFTQRFKVNPRSTIFKGPVVVLVDELSMSTSEIFAAGLKDIGRAEVIGVRSPGAALPSLIVTLPNGDRFQYAYANYLSFAGEPLEGKGVTPNQLVPLSRQSLLSGQDNQLKAAVAWIKATRSGSGVSYSE